MPGGTVHPAGLSGLAGRYDLLLCDVWGVLHNGVAAFPAAVDALQRFRAGGGRVLLVSNAPRPQGVIAGQLDRLQVPADAYDGILTSGDVARSMIAARGPAPLRHIGPERDLSLFDGLACRLVPLQQADYIVCTGLFDDERETAADYAAELAAAHARGLPMICANPDLVVDRGGRSIPCAGVIGQAYEALGGVVSYPGKPYGPIYAAALAMAASQTATPAPLGRTLAVGDAMRTDIAGAKGAGIAALMVLEGIHAHELRGLEPEALDQWFAGQPHQPDYAMAHLRW